MDNFKVLNDFVDRAVRNRNYALNTAYGFKAALKLFEAVAHEDEKASLEKLEQRFEKMYEDVCRKNSDKMSAKTLEAYKIRVVKVLNDYKEYGVNPAKMASWPSKTITRAKRSVPAELKETAKPNTAPVDQVENIPIGAERLEWPLGRPGAKFVAYIPADVTEADIKKMKTLLDLVEVKN